MFFLSSAGPILPHCGMTKWLSKLKMPKSESVSLTKAHSVQFPQIFPHMFIRCQSPKYENGFQHLWHLTWGRAMNTNDENL